MLKLLNTTFGQNDTSIGFERDGARRQLEITKRAANPYPLNIRGKFHGRISLKDVFGFSTSRKWYIWFEIWVDF